MIFLQRSCLLMAPRCRLSVRSFRSGWSNNGHAVDVTATQMTQIVDSKFYLIHRNARSREN